MAQGNSGNQFGAALSDYVERLDDIADQRAMLTAKAGEVYREIREAGLNAKAVRRIVQERRMDQDALAAFNDTLDNYREALGDLDGTPLGDASMPVNRGVRMMDA
jgi:uncharacterized protein (UPF0335 family)